MQRCFDTNLPNYHRYGGRGITVCEKWQTFEGFFEDMGERPSDLHSIEREDNDGPYQKSNCCWGTDKQQARNRRSNRIVEFRGREMSLAEAVEIAALPYHAVKKRLNRGWDTERALTEPVRA